MPFYQRINTKTKCGKRTARRLMRLKDALSVIPTKTVDERLLLATWNIRDFDKPAYGERSDEAIYYIAEIISRFDIVAVQEVYKDLKGLNRVLKVLGGYWKYIITDMAGDGRGNKERMTFLYDSRKVSFGGLAGELVLPEVKIKENGKSKVVPAEQVWRTPFICGFKAGWSRFMLASVHILWGGGKAEPANRVEEINAVAEFLRKRTEDDTAWSRNLILLGDFNIFSTEDETFKRLTNHGFTVPDKLKEFASNAARNRHYDQIAFRVQPDRLDQTGECGVFDFYEHVFTADDESLYISDMGPAYLKNSKGKPRTTAQKRTYYKTNWRTHQMSDHLPMWVELKIDYSARYLERKLSGGV
ncbi:MAG: endonuclease/exonuclease/phosphatase family protein [Planctomycetaceae bacterium]|nr:endonuclease/exonuclease/phosphatase family protein [Planctomycetales bacterium]MCB9924304.1 endonuclease/exonuclease/phosphatase family protein [Planctomycetaceae bacterium]